MLLKLRNKVEEWHISFDIKSFVISIYIYFKIIQCLRWVVEILHQLGMKTPSKIGVSLPKPTITSSPNRICCWCLPHANPPARHIKKTLFFNGLQGSWQSPGDDGTMCLRFSISAIAKIHDDTFWSLWCHWSSFYKFITWNLSNVKVFLWPCSQNTSHGTDGWLT